MTITAEDHKRIIELNGTGYVVPSIRFKELRAWVRQECTNSAGDAYTIKCVFIDENYTDTFFVTSAMFNRLKLRIEENKAKPSVAITPDMIGKDVNEIARKIVADHAKRFKAEGLASTYGGGGAGGRATFTSEPKRKYKVTLAPLKWEAGETGAIALWFADTPYGRILVGRNGRVNLPWQKDDQTAVNEHTSRAWAEEQYRAHVLKAFVKVKERK